MLTFLKEQDNSIKNDVLIMEELIITKKKLLLNTL